VRIADDGTVTSAVSPHALRRTFATILLDQGHHIDAIADVLGHASIDATRQHYAFASTARRRATILAYNLDTADQSDDGRFATWMRRIRAVPGVNSSNDREGRAGNSSARCRQ
jgi:hypothetical protein